VQQLHPNRPENHPENRPPPARGREALLAAEGSAVGGERAGEFFEAPGPAW
jgi:hypothetical protein